MSAKPDGSTGKKAKPATAYVARVKKLNLKARRLEAIRKSVGGKKMTTPRGTERAKRREGISAGWRRDKSMKQMRPAKGVVTVEPSTHSFTSVASLTEALSAHVGDPPKARATPEEVLKKNQAGVEKATKTMTRTRKPRAKKEVAVEAGDVL